MKIKTYKKNKNNHHNIKFKSYSKTYKNNTNIEQLQQFKTKITIIFFQFLLMIKLYHWNTFSFSTHKATDELYSKFNTNMDSFMEILLGKTAKNRINIKSNFVLSDIKTKEEFIHKLNQFKTFLVGLSEEKAMKIMSNTDLYNIRDTILGDINQLLYLLTLE